MSDIQGRPVNSGLPYTKIPSSVEPPSGRKAPSASDQGTSGATGGAQDVQRALLADIGAQALSVQRGAAAARKAIKTLRDIEAAVTFALDAANEATTIRGLGEGAVGALQAQLDLAITSVDSIASQACVGETALFNGRFAVEIADQRLALPKIASQDLGGTEVAVNDSWNLQAAGVEYSQSIASAASGGPNSLAVCADGARQALTSGLSRLREARRGLEDFYRESVLPRAAEISVALANALATDSRTENLDEVTEILAEVRRQLQDAPAAGAETRGADGILKLFE